MPEENTLTSHPAVATGKTGAERPATSRRAEPPGDSAFGAPLTFLAVFIALLAMLVASMWEVTDMTRTESFETAEQIYSTKYDITVLPAPNALGWQLSLLARVAVSVPLGDLLIRILIQRTGIPKVVELAEALQRDDGPYSGAEYGLSEPLVRLSNDEWAWHKQASEETLTFGAQTFATDRQGGKYRSVRDFHDAYKSGRTKPWEVLKKLVDFINRTDAELRCVQELDLDGASQAAAASSARWTKGEPLGVWDGVPVLIKPEEAVRGLHDTVGQQVRRDDSDVARDDGVLVARLRAAGAVVVGTTVMHERGVQPTGYNPWYRGPMNPFDTARFSGGSSSGSAVAVATGMVPVSIGWDGGGSIRLPAAWSGVTGLAPGFGRVPYSKGANVAEMSKAGPLSSYVADSAEALLLLGRPLTSAEGRDRHPWHVLYGGDGPPPAHVKPRWDGQGRGVRVGVFKEWVEHRPEGWAAGVTADDDAVHAAFERSVAALERSGLRAEMVAVRLPQMRIQQLSHVVLISSLFSMRLLAEGFKGSSSLETPRSDDDLQLATQIQLRIGRKLSVMEVLAARRVRAFALAQWRRVLGEEVDVVLTPTVPMTAVRRPDGSDLLGYTDATLFVQMMRFVWPGNLVGLPGLAVPTGTDSAGLPVSMQVICAHWHEADCLAVGAELERAFAEERRTPPLFVDLLADQDEPEKA